MLGSPDTFDRFNFDGTFELLIIWINVWSCNIWGVLPILECPWQLLLRTLKLFWIVKTSVKNAEWTLLAF